MAGVAIAIWQDLCIDALDVTRLATFWAGVTGLTRVGPVEHTRLEGFSDAHRVWINEVDRPHRVKNRVHLDIYARAVDDLISLGPPSSSPPRRPASPGR